MRKSELAEAISLALTPLLTRLDRYADAGSALADAIDLLNQAVQEIHPAHVDLSQELADDIVRKITGPLTIPQSLSDMIAKEAQHHDMLVIGSLGYSAERASLYWTMRPDGRLTLEIQDPYGARWWFGTFQPPTIEE